MTKILCSLMFVLLSFGIQAATLEIVTSDYPPFQIVEGDKVNGMATEIVREILKRSGHTGTISAYPWARAYQIALHNPNVLIYSIARNNEREKLFKWIGAVVPFNLYFWKLSNRIDIKVQTIADAKRYVVGGVFDDIKAAHLQKLGFVPGKNLEMVRNDELNIHKLFGNHIDLIPFDEMSFPYKVTRAGHDVKKISKLIKIEGLSSELYIAASLNTPDGVVLDLKKALADFKKSEKFKKLKEKYIFKRNDEALKYVLASGPI